MLVLPKLRVPSTPSSRSKRTSRVAVMRRAVYLGTHLPTQLGWYSKIDFFGYPLGYHMGADAG